MDMFKNVVKFWDEDVLLLDEDFDEEDDDE